MRRKDLSQRKATPPAPDINCQTPSATTNMTTHLRMEKKYLLEPRQPLPRAHLMDEDGLKGDEGTCRRRKRRGQRKGISKCKEIKATSSLSERAAAAVSCAR